MNMKDNILVSIVVPSYNHSQYLEECINSIFNQSYKNFELFVIDDASTDNSVEIIKKLKRTYDFKLIEKQINKGVSHSLNLGFRDLAKGDYLTSCASDDYWHKDKLKEQVKFLMSNHEFSMVFCKTFAVDNSGKILEKITNKINFGLKGGNIFKDIILQRFHPPVGYMFNSKIFKKVGYYDQNIWAEDFDMNLKISENHNIGFINKFLCYYRINKNSEKNLSFKTIFSHKTSIEKYRYSEYYKQAIKNWYYKCFLWYSPYKSGKKIAFFGMIKNLDRFFTKEFIIFFSVLLRKWK